MSQGNLASNQILDNFQNEQFLIAYAWLIILAITIVILNSWYLICFLIYTLNVKFLNGWLKCLMIFNL